MNNLPAFTIAGWICPTATQANRTGLFGQNDTMEFGFSSSSTVQIWTPVGSVSASYPFPNNTWHYVTAVGGSGQLALYFDGVPKNTTAISASNFGESDYDFNIGGGGVFDPTGNYFKGQIDEVAVWFRALATNEITTLLATNAEQVSLHVLHRHRRAFANVWFQRHGLCAHSVYGLPIRTHLTICSCSCASMTASPHF